MKKLNVSQLVALAFLAIASSTTLKAQVLQVDFQRYNHTPQSGFESMNIDGDGGPQQSTFGNYTVSVAAGPLQNSSGITTVFGYGGNPSGPYDTLYSGGWAPYASDLRVEVDGLDADTSYTLTFQSVNQYSGTGVGYVHLLSSLFDTTLGTYEGQVNTVTEGYPGAPYPTSLTPGANGNGYFTFTATSDDYGSLFFADSVINASGNATGYGIQMNGFEINAVAAPEPSSSSMMLLGAGAVGAIYILRRRKLSA